MRYKNQQLFRNEARAYIDYLKRTRGMESITQYSTAKFKHPSAEEMGNFNTIQKIWTTGDRYFKLADEYYGDPQMWWIIALFNQKPTEFDLKLGDIVHVPVPLESVLYYIGY